MALSIKATAFLAAKPALIGHVAGFDLYEHPTMGDEAPLFTILDDGRLRRTSFYDLPSAAELLAEVK